MSKNKFTGISCKPEIKEKVASLGTKKETWDELLESLYDEVMQCRGRLNGKEKD